MLPKRSIKLKMSKQRFFSISVVPLLISTDLKKNFLTETMKKKVYSADKNHKNLKLLVRCFR